MWRHRRKFRLLVYICVDIFGEKMRRPGSPRKLEEWVDGFLFLGNHLALDFLNTKPILEGQPRELLLNVVGLERWLIAAGLVRSRKERSLVQRWRNSPEGEAFVRKLVAFRERFRAAVLRLESGLRPKEGFVAEVNVLLKMHALHTNLTKQGPKLALIRFFEPRKRMTFGHRLLAQWRICSLRLIPAAFANANRSRA